MGDSYRRIAPTSGVHGFVKTEVPMESHDACISSARCGSTGARTLVIVFKVYTPHQVRSAKFTKGGRRVFVTCSRTVTTARRSKLSGALAYKQSLVMSKYREDSVMLAKFVRELMTGCYDMSDRSSLKHRFPHLLGNCTSHSRQAPSVPGYRAHASYNAQPTGTIPRQHTAKNSKNGREHTKPISDLVTRPILFLPSPSPIFPNINRAEFLILRIDSAACASTVGPIDISRQYSTVATHNLSTSAPYTGSFFLSYQMCPSDFASHSEQMTTRHTFPPSTMVKGLTTFPKDLLIFFPC